MAISSGWPGAGSYYLGRHGEGDMKRPLYLTTPTRGAFDPESMQGPQQNFVRCRSHQTRRSYAFCPNGVLEFFHRKFTDQGPSLRKVKLRFRKM